LAGGDFEEKFL